MRVQRRQQQRQRRDPVLLCRFCLRAAVDGADPLLDLGVDAFHFLQLLVRLVIVAIGTQTLVAKNVLLVRLAQRRDALGEQSSELEVVLTKERQCRRLLFS